MSTDEQAAHGVSLAAQKGKVAAHAELYDLELVAVIEDGGASGKTLDRPGLKHALAMLQRGEARALIVFKLDRLTRSVRDLGELIERHFGPGGAALHSVSEQVDTSTAGGRMVLNILTTIAQWEREVICERTTLALRHKTAKGERVGSIPYGMRLAADGRTLEPDPGERETITAARRLRRQGLSRRGIAAELRCEGMTARKGGEFTAAAVLRMLEPDRPPVALATTASR